MKDIARAAQARAAYLRASESDVVQFDGLETLLDLYALLVLVKGEQCTEEDVRHAWRVTGLRVGPGRVGWFDNVEGGVIRDVGGFAEEERIFILNAARIVSESRRDDNPGGSA